MRNMVKQVVLPAGVMLLCSVLILAGVGAVVTHTMPCWRDSVFFQLALSFSQIALSWA